MLRKISVLKIIVVLWIIFSALYIVYNEWGRFKATVMQASYNRGVEDAVAKVIDEAKACKAFPVNVGEAKVTLVSVDCLKQPSEAPSQNK